MAKEQYAYQDAHGRIYPAHPAMLAQPGLVPGWYNVETRTFRPTGNPQEQVGNIITDAGVGNGQEQVLSGLRNDKGAGTAPINGVAFTLPSGESDPDLAAQVIELEAQLAEERQRNAALEAQLVMRQGGVPGATTGGEGVNLGSVGDDGGGEQTGSSGDGGAEDKGDGTSGDVTGSEPDASHGLPTGAVAPPVKRVRKVSQ
ncbi:hypothetical protein SAMN05444172_2580 [Burkholderia sp. GAS332]|nr:hypothetical protein SAMN05444172_2580 [Burkholderia sp. GAS332]